MLTIISKFLSPALNCDCGLYSDFIEPSRLFHNTLSLCLDAVLLKDVCIALRCQWEGCTFPHLHPCATCFDEKFAAELINRPRFSQLFMFIHKLDWRISNSVWSSPVTSKSSKVDPGLRFTDVTRIGLQWNRKKTAKHNRNNRNL